MIIIDIPCLDILFNDANNRYIRILSKYFFLNIQICFDNVDLIDKQNKF